MARPSTASRFSLAALDVAAVGSFGLLWLWGMVRLLEAASPAESAALVALGLLPGLLLADLATGLVHWIADTFFREDTPWIGPLFIRSFREHHREPAAMAERGVIAVSGHNCLASLPLAGALVLWPIDSPAWRGLGLALALFLLALALTNLFHRWAHARNVPALAAWLQRRGFILSPARHALHHSRAHDRAFCVTTGWLNPWLDRVRFFGRLESRLRSIASRPRPRRSGGLAKRFRAN